MRGEGKEGSEVVEVKQWVTLRLIQENIILKVEREHPIELVFINV